MVENSGRDSYSENGLLNFNRGNFLARPKYGGLPYANFIFDIYNRVATVGIPKFTGEQVPMPTTLNPLLTQPKKDSTSRTVIMDLSWPLPPGLNVNGSVPRDMYLGMPRK